MSLQARGLVKALGGRRVVDGVALQVDAGQVVGLLGPNGAGKSTTFHLLTGLLRPDAGQVSLDGVVLEGPLHQRVRAGLGYLPQRPALFSGLRVREQLLVPIEARGGRAEEADLLLERVQLTHLAGQRAARLSGGERRRLELARCLATRPRILLLDEPFAGVDPVQVEALRGQIRALTDEGIGVLLTDHAVREAMSVCDHVVLLDQGRVLVHGTPQEIVEHPQARKKWLGSEFEG